MFEFRFYSVAPGRLASELALVYDMACRSDFDGRSLWDLYSVPMPVGSWTGLSGSRLPAFLYIIKWNSLTERDACFPRFWSDPTWQKRRAELTDGMPLVDSIENWLLDASPAWKAHMEERSDAKVGGVHELRIQKVLNGSQAAAAEALSDVYLPAEKSQGARVLGVFDLVIGPDRPLMMTMLAWPDIETKHAAAYQIDRDARVLAQRQAEKQRFGRRLFGELDQYLLEPVEWNTPFANLGESA